VIVSAPVPANLAASKATSTIPIVMANGADPVSFGLVQSLSRPGGNVTGLTNFAEDLASKQLDIIRELLPHLARVGAIINCREPAARSAMARDPSCGGQGVASPRAF
jgi:putative ABC transport system substrate-binding protein